MKTKPFLFHYRGTGTKMSKKCNSPAEFPGLVVFLAVFFRNFDKNRKM